MPEKWNVFVTSDPMSGEYISAPLSILPPTGKVSTDRVRSFFITTTPVTPIPSGTTIKAYLRESNDSGASWSAWRASHSSTYLTGSTTALFDTSLTATYENYRVQYKYELYTADGGVTPAVNITTTVAFAAKATSWVSPILDWSSSYISDTLISYVTGRDSSYQDATVVTRDTSYTAKLYVRSGDSSTTLGAWVECSNNAVLPSVGDYLQFKWEVVTLSEYTRQGVYLDDITLTAKRGGGLKGIWTSPALDIRVVDDKGSGKVSSEIVSGIDTTYNIQTRSRTDSSSSWSDWYSIGANGSCQHPSNNEVQLRIAFTGIDTKVDSLTLAYDGVPNAAALLTGLPTNVPYVFTVFKDLLIIANGVSAVKKWDGVSAVANLGGSPPVFSCLEVHNNSLWGVEVGTSRLRMSKILDPESWGVLDFFDFNPDDGDYITAIIRFGTNLVVSKSRSMAMLMGATSATYNIRWLETSTGAQGAKAICVADKYLAYASKQGIMLTDLMDYINISEKVADMWESIDKRKLDKAVLFYRDDKIYCLLTSNQSTVNNQLWIYDLRYAAWDIQPNYGLSDITTFNIAGAEEFISLDASTGNVYVMDEGNNTPAGNRTSYVWQTKTFDMGYPERYKLFKGIYLDLEGISVESTLTMSFIVDDTELPDKYTTVIPAGEGDAHTRWILPPLFNAVLGTHLALKFEGSVGIKGISIEYVTRGVSPEGLL